jgi:hypothetical protein
MKVWAVMWTEDYYLTVHSLHDSKAKALGEMEQLKRKDVNKLCDFEVWGWEVN